MRVLLYLEMDLSLTKGPSINERESALSLLNLLGDQIIIVAPKPRYPEIFSDARIRYIHNHRGYNPFHYLGNLLSCYCTISHLLAHNEVDAIITRPPLMPVVIYLFQKRGFPIILKKLSGISVFESQDRNWKVKIVSILTKRLLGSLARNCVGADVESFGYIEWLSDVFELSKGKLRMVSNGVNADIFRPYNKSEAKKKFNLDHFHSILGYVGRLDSLRHVTLALESMKIISDVPGLGMVFVGNGPLMSHLKVLIKEYGLEDRVLMTGFLPYESIPEVINTFDVAFDLTYVKFQLSNRVQGGSYSQKIAQYLACGVPVVAWDTEDTIFLSQAGIGSIVPYGNINELAKAFRMELNKTNKAEIAQACRNYALSFLSSDAIAHKRIKYWNQLVCSKV